MSVGVSFAVSIVTPGIAISIVAPGITISIVNTVTLDITATPDITVNIVP
ncbi:hypothetical protein HPS57_07100 [Prevotella sp. PINT]|nr:hypothetical protein [Palleniella intestinalis]NPD81740.1 hypothetical protein [Palleniella intestinalis]